MPHAVTGPGSNEMMDSLRIRPDFGQPPPGWPSSPHSNHLNNSRFIPTNGNMQYVSSPNCVPPRGWVNNQQQHSQSQFPQFHGTGERPRSRSRSGSRANTNNQNQNVYSYAHAARAGNFPPQPQYRPCQNISRNASIDPRFALSSLPLMAGDCIVNGQKPVPFNVNQSFGVASPFIRPTNNNVNWCWSMQQSQAQTQMGYRVNNNGRSDVQMPIITNSNANLKQQCFDHNIIRRNNNDPYTHVNYNTFKNKPVTDYQKQMSENISNKNLTLQNHQENVLHNRSVGPGLSDCNGNSEIVYQNHCADDEDKSITPLGLDRFNTGDNKEVVNHTSECNIEPRVICDSSEEISCNPRPTFASTNVRNCRFAVNIENLDIDLGLDKIAQKRHHSITHESNTNTRKNDGCIDLDECKIERLVIYDSEEDDEDEVKFKSHLFVNSHEVKKYNIGEEEKGHISCPSNYQKIEKAADVHEVCDAVNYVDQERSQHSDLEIDLDQGIQNCEDGSNEDNENTQTEEQSQIDQDGSENLGEKRKFTKSYWRKQRRLRLKERLLAQKTLMENDPDHVPEEKDNPKSVKAAKVKEIDYDSYLPAHVLMHVKRDLVSVLMEYGQTREVKVAFEDMERSGPHHASRFHTAAIVDNEKFLPGSGSSKKNAKKAAAAHALKTMYERGKKNLETVNERAHKRLSAMTPEEVGTHAHRVVLVSRHVLETVEETQFINYSKDKISATFVLEYHGKMRVVGLGTGNRCILYQHMTKDGKRVIHSHAEVMARRAFIRYLYRQLMNYQANRAHPIFARSDTGKLKIRDKIQVHLYISRPPCGDAAAFPTISNFPNKMRAIRKQGQLRTIIDDGEGAIPTDFAVPAGANGKERLRIMTCSDKICRWNVLGVQGALLSHFLDPIYINSLVIGSHTGDQRGHVPRAVSGRLKCGRLHEVILRPYRINSPEIHYPIDELADQYNITKSKQYCITWSYGDTDAEILDAITGLTNMEDLEEEVSSRVSKTVLFDLFHQVCQKFGRNELLPLDYMKAKKSAITFNRTKSFVGQHLSAMGFGQWYSLQETYGTDNFPCPEECCWPRLCDCRHGPSQSGNKLLLSSDSVKFLIKVSFQLYLYTFKYHTTLNVLENEILIVVSTSILFYMMRIILFKRGLEICKSVCYVLRFSLLSICEVVS